MPVLPNPFRLAVAVDRRLAGAAVDNCTSALAAAADLRRQHRLEEGELTLLGLLPAGEPGPA